MSKDEVVFTILMVICGLTLGTSGTLGYLKNNPEEVTGPISQDISVCEARKGADQVCKLGYVNVDKRD